MNDAMRRLEVLVGEWDVTMVHAWFLDSLDTEIKGLGDHRVAGRCVPRHALHVGRSLDAGIRVWPE